MTPVRLQLSRKKGFNLQELSRATNRLDVVKVTRPGRWGNPFDFRKSEYCWTALSYGCRGDRLGRQEASVRAFREWINPPNGKRIIYHEETPKFGNGKDKSVAIGPTVTAGEAPSLDDVKAELRGKNLACWCKIIDQHGNAIPCHADVLLSLANDLPMEEVIREGVRRAKGQAVR